MQNRFGGTVKISGVMIGRDNEWCVERALRSLMHFDEVVFGDTGSVDKTREIAYNLGARLRVVEIEKEPFHFAWAKNEVIRQAANDHIFLLDTDEYIVPDIYNWLKERFSMYPNARVVLPRFEQHSPQMFIRMFYPSYQCRGWDRTVACLEKAVHEIVVGGYPEIVSPYHLFHRGWADMERDTIHWRYFEFLLGKPAPSMEESQRLMQAGFEQMATTYEELPERGKEEMARYEEATGFSPIIVPPPLSDDELLWQRNL